MTIEKVTYVNYTFSFMMDTFFSHSAGVIMNRNAINNFRNS